MSSSASVSLANDEDVTPSTQSAGQPSSDEIGNHKQQTQQHQLQQLSPRQTSYTSPQKKPKKNRKARPKLQPISSPDDPSPGNDSFGFGEFCNAGRAKVNEDDMIGKCIGGELESVAEWEREEQVSGLKVAANVVASEARANIGGSVEHDKEGTNEAFVGKSRANFEGNEITNPQTQQRRRYSTKKLQPRATLFSPDRVPDNPDDDNYDVFGFGFLKPSPEKSLTDEQISLATAAAQYSLDHSYIPAAISPILRHRSMSSNSNSYISDDESTVSEEGVERELPFRRLDETHPDKRPLIVEHLQCKDELEEFVQERNRTERDELRTPSDNESETYPSSVDKKNDYLGRRRVSTQTATSSVTFYEGESFESKARSDTVHLMSSRMNPSTQTEGGDVSSPPLDGESSSFSESRQMQPTWMQYQYNQPPTMYAQTQQHASSLPNPPPALLLRAQSAPQPHSTASNSIRDAIEMKLSLSVSEESSDEDKREYEDGLYLFPRKQSQSSIVESASSEDGSPRRIELERETTTTPFSSTSDDVEVTNELSAYSASGRARENRQKATPSGRITPVESICQRKHSIRSEDNTPTHAEGAKRFYASPERAMIAAKTSASKPKALARVHSDASVHSSPRGAFRSTPPRGLYEPTHIHSSQNGGIEEKSFKVYSARWLMLFWMSFLNLLSDWTCYSVAPIAILTMESFHVDAESLVTIFLAANAIASAFEPMILGRLGLRKTVVFGALLLMLGSIVKSGGTPFLGPLCENDAWRVYVGFFLVGLSQPLYQCTPALLSASWFPTDERTIATGVALNSNQLGIGCAFVFGSQLVTKVDDIVPYFQLLSFVSTVAFIGVAWQFDDSPPTPPSDTARVIRGTMEVGIPNFGKFFVRKPNGETLVNRRGSLDSNNKPRKSPNISGQKQTPRRGSSSQLQALSPAHDGKTTKTESILAEQFTSYGSTDATSLVNISPVESIQRDDESLLSASPFSKLNRFPSFGYYNLDQQFHIESRLPPTRDEGAEPIMTQTPHNLDIDIRDDQIWLSIKACFNRKGFAHTVVAFTTSGIVINTLSTFMDHLVQLNGAGREYVGIVGGTFQLLIMIASMLVGSWTDKSRKYFTSILMLLVLGAFALSFCSVQLDQDRGVDLRVALLFVAVVAGPLQPLSTELGVEVVYPLSENTVLVVQQLCSNLLSAAFIPVFKMLRHVATVSKPVGDVEIPEFTLSFYLLVLIHACATIYFASFNGLYLRHEEETRKTRPKESTRGEGGGYYSGKEGSSIRWPNDYAQSFYQPLVPPGRDASENYPFLLPVPYSMGVV